MFDPVAQNSVSGDLWRVAAADQEADNSSVVPFDASVRPIPKADEQRRAGTAEVRWLRPPSLAAIRIRSYLALLTLDVLALAAGFLTANLLWLGNLLAAPGLQYLIAFVPVFLAISFSQRAYTVTALEKPRRGSGRVLKALALTAAALLLALFYAKTSAVMSRGVFGIGVMLAGGLLVLNRQTLGVKLGRAHNWNFQNEVVLVDGVAPHASETQRVIYAEHAQLNPYHNDPAMAARIGRLLDGYDRVVLQCDPKRRAQWVRALKGVGIDVEVMTPELDHLGALALRHLDGGSAVLVAAGPLGLRDRVVKRAFDLVVGGGMLLFFAPLMIFVAIAVKLSSPGPVLFKQVRIGRGNRPFEVLKFRTMLVDACDANGVQSALRADPRVTRIGAFLRRTSIDELPQLLNVVRGDMSIVGPRPHATASTAENDLFWHIDERYWDRGAVKPGITGLAQVLGYRGATSTRKDLTNRVQADLEYLADWSISKDIWIIFRTLRVVVHPNAY